MSNLGIMKVYLGAVCVMCCASVYASKPKPNTSQANLGDKNNAAIETKKRTLDPTTLVDPTLPLGYNAKGKQQSSLKLQAIFLGDNRKEAIVNGVSVKEGDRLQGKRIVKIKNDAIVIEKNGGFRTLVLRPSIFK